MSGSDGGSNRRSKPTVLLFGPPSTAVSGVATYVQQLLRSSVGTDFRLIHFPVGSEGLGANAERFWPTLARGVVSMFQLARALRRERVKIVHSNTSLVPKSFWRDLVYLTIAKLAGCRVVFQVHGGSLAELRKRWKVAAWVYRKMLPSADAVVVISHQEARSHRAIVHPERLHVIPNAVDLTEYAGIRTDWHPGPGFVIGYLGRLHEDKGIFDLIAALTWLQQNGQGEGVRLIIAGAGPHETPLRDAIVRHDLQRCIEVRGSVQGPDKLRFWADIDLFVLPSHHEGLPYTVLESLAAGVPLVASHVGAIPEAIEDGVHGRLVPAREPLILAKTVRRLRAAAPESRARMSRACHDRAHAMYGLHRLAIQISEVYGKLAYGPIPAWEKNTVPE